MSRDRSQRTLHHDLRGALSAVQMNLQTLEALEADEAEVTVEKRLAIVQRAKAALAEAVELVDRLKADGSGSAADRN
ncbi:MAG: hypothetical protein ACLFRX_00460 [Gemmatimonadota bacterium]